MAQLVLANVKLANVASQDEHDVEIRDGVVSSIKAAASTISERIDLSAERIDLRGHYLSLGLVDHHTHL